MLIKDRNGVYKQVYYSKFKVYGIRNLKRQRKRKSYQSKKEGGS